MTGKGKARGSCSYARANGKETRSIVANYDMACLAAGLIFAVSFGLMFLWAAVMW